MKRQLPAKGKYCTYDTDLGRVLVEKSDEKGWYCIQNITTAASYVPGNRFQTFAWLEKHKAKFVNEE